MKVPISEIFYSIQGEGRNVGMPSVFVRFWGCNLQCKRCDSKYARAGEYINERELLDLENVLEKITSFGSNHIIFTGGEPSLYEDIIKEIQNKLGNAYTYEIETNGSRELKNKYNQVNVSYKLSNSGNDKYELKTLDDSYDYKFVCKNRKDLEEMEEVIQEYDLPIDNIFVMPMGINDESQNNKEILNYCLEEGLRYCQRMHILLFGDKKGV